MTSVVGNALKGSARAATAAGIAKRQQGGNVDMAMSAQLSGGFTFQPGHDLTDGRIVAWRAIEDVRVATDSVIIAFLRDDMIDDASTVRDIASAGRLMSLQPLTERELGARNRGKGIPTAARIKVSPAGETHTILGDIEPGDSIDVLLRPADCVNDILVGLRVKLDQLKRQRDVVWDLHLADRIRAENVEERLATLAVMQDDLQTRLLIAEQGAAEVKRFPVAVVSGDSFDSIAARIAESASAAGVPTKAKGATLTIDSGWIATFTVIGLQPPEPFSLKGMV